MNSVVNTVCHQALLYNNLYLGLMAVSLLTSLKVSTCGVISAVHENK